MAFKAKHPRNIPAAYYKPIGQLIVRWGFIELYLQSIIWHIWRIRDPKAARLLTWDLNAASKVELFKYLSPKWVSDLKHQSELRAIATEADRLRGKRNRVAHGLWGYKSGERNKVRLLQIGRQNRVLPKTETVTVQDVKQWAEQLDKLNIRIKEFHRELGAPTP
ncbi:MAG TPA: hypothetical protein VFR18_16235 [Terriglobia bacterium]|nr:hypothetical protein [Terriglobia bacterium]